MESWIIEAIAKWRNEGVELNLPASISAIESTETVLDFKFPDDFKKLYLMVNGFVDFEYRGFFLSLWSLGRIIDDYDKDKEFIMFSDYSLSVCQYGFHRDKKGIFKTYTHHQQGPAEYVAETFRQMIAFINSDSELLF